MMDEKRKIEEFERLLTGEGGVADDELAGLFLMARGMEANAAKAREAVPAMRPDFRAALRTQLLDQASGTVPLALHRRVRASVQARNVKMRRSFKQVVAIAAVMMVSLVGGSLVAMAQSTVPGDALYGIKTARENIALHAVFGPVPRANRQLELARERLDEIKVLADRRAGDAALYVTALQDMDARTLDATKLLITEYRSTNDNGVLSSLVGFALAQRQGLEAVAGTVPPGARPKTRSSIELVQAVQNRVSSVLGGCPCPADALTPAGNVAPGTPGRVDCSCTAAKTRPSGTSSTTPQTQTEKPKDATPRVTDPKTGDTVSGPLPDVTGTGTEQQVNDLINGLLENLGVSSPSPLPSPSVSLPLP